MMCCLGKHRWLKCNLHRTLIFLWLLSGHEKWGLSSQWLCSLHIPSLDSRRRHRAWQGTSESNSCRTKNNYVEVISWTRTRPLFWEQALSWLSIFLLSSLIELSPQRILTPDSPTEWWKERACIWPGGLFKCHLNHFPLEGIGWVVINAESKWSVHVSVKQQE